MARHFTAASGDYVDFGPGSVAMVDGGPATIVALWRPTTVHEGWLIDAQNAAGAHAFSINPYSDGYLWHTLVGFRQTMAYAVADGWRLDLWSKASGTAQVRGHRLLLSGGSWSHTDYGACADSPNVPTTGIRVGRHFAASGALNGDIAAVAVVGADWSDAAIEAADLSSGLAAWIALIGSDPAVVWGFNQASVADLVSDVTGGGGDQVAISGTSVAAADPPGFSYLLSTPTDCAMSAVLPAVGGALVADSSSTSVLGGVLPMVDAQFSAGALLRPPLLVGAASVWALSGSAAVV